MSILEKFENFNRRLSTFFECVGLAGLLVMAFLTCSDVVGAKLFQRPIFGAIDIVMLAQIVAISFAVASVLILGRHVQVEFFVSMLPKRVQAAIDIIVHIFGLALFVLIIWRLGILGYSFQTGGEGSATARIPLYPFAYGIALACIPVCLVFVVKFFNALAKVVRR
ncbi:MAG: TRAP transporter small permease [Nitrospinaceae bacterium]|jgi:TRAP-type C4-dicarboxylate transport system permease small subunit|nr:TRAP transporter small permease [Nitrospinaceae bacterium]|tara:strand:- start:18974 stop:19471 length:498 start_codon:yes stop_codon:yes gene_type:complete